MAEARAGRKRAKKIEVKVGFSEDVFLSIRSAGFSEESIRKGMKRTLALDLFKNGILSFGKAASLAGICKSDFMDLIDKENIPLHYGVESLGRDAAIAGALSKEMER